MSGSKGVSGTRTLMLGGRRCEWWHGDFEVSGVGVHWTERDPRKRNKKC
jgi:hypothetical protein